MNISTLQAAEARERAIMERLLTTDLEGRQGQPLTAEELLDIGRSALEPLFHEPPAGPIPDYLALHRFVHGCVAEYEEQIEALDRWKALQLSGWLKDRVGKHWRIAGKCFRLQIRRDRNSGADVFMFAAIAGPCDHAARTPEES